ncbi:MAG: hypothetical protein JRJ85_11315 [Deltaproteobacteria bacterium]|nr:hypothetical protein [Deltaproteobacteria bacterium]
MSICLQKVEIDNHTVQLFQDEEGGHITGWSFSRGKYYENPLNDLPPNYKPIKMGKTKKEIEFELKEIAEYNTLALPSRGLRQETLDRFHIKTGVSQEDGETVTSVHFPYTCEGNIVAYKTRLVEVKKMWWVGDNKDVDFFGWEQAIQSGSPKLFIVEGEYDVPATYQMLKDNSKGGKWAHLEPAVISLKDGVGSAKKAIAKAIPLINKHFKDITLIFDMDEKGQQAVKEVAMIVPHALVATLPEKDANACLIEGRQKGFCNAVRGIRYGETIYITGAEKIGKSDVLNTIVAHLVKEHKVKCFVCKPEEANVKTVKMLAGKMVGKIFHDPLVPFDEDAYQVAVNFMRGKVELVNIFQNVEWDILKGDITAAAVDGCKAVFIDPLTVLTTGMSAADANVKLQEIAQNLSSLALDLNIVIFIFTHLKTPKHGLPYNRGGKINVNDITGSRGMIRSCNLIIGIQGNNDPELEDDERNLRDLVLLSDREHGAAGVVHLWWNRLTSLFTELGK